MEKSSPSREMAVQAAAISVSLFAFLELHALAPGNGLDHPHHSRTLVWLSPLDARQRIHRRSRNALTASPGQSSRTFPELITLIIYCGGAARCFEVQTAPRP